MGALEGEHVRAAGSVAPLMRAVDWGATSLGPEDDWTPALGCALGLTLQTRYPAALLWGPDFVLLYNEAFVELIGDKHPGAMGRPAADVFGEAWSIIGPLMKQVRTTGESVWLENARVPLIRSGFLEDCYFTFSYSAVTAPDGTIEGILDVAAETTREVLAVRRLALLGELGGALVEVIDTDGLPEATLEVLRRDHADLPEVDLVRAPVLPSPHLSDGPTGTRAVLPVRPPKPGRTEDLQLVVLLSDRLPHDDAYLDFLRLLAHSVGQTLDRLEALELERERSARDRQLAETLQHSLLSEPHRPEGLELAVRYLPAATDAQVGGDWYDSFATSAGELALVVGDVAGHDRDSAAAMGQLRSLTRGIVHTLGQGPATILSAVDRAVSALMEDAFATMVLAQLSHPDPHGVRRLRLANAGHPPPMLLRADGGVELLAVEPEELLGVGGTERHEHVVELRPGDTLLLYTDGLVERRRVAIDVSIEALRSYLAGLAGLGAEQVCDRLIAALDDEVEDDVALLVVRLPPA